VVVEVGSGVTNCAVNSRVSVEGYLNCGVCAHCQRGETNLCENHEQIGLTENGGFAEYVVAPAKSCHLVPDAMGLDEAILVEPAATIVRGIEREPPESGFKAAVLGCGPMGQIALRVLALYRPSHVLAIDLSEHQRSMAMRAGATSFASTSDVSVLAQMSGADGWDVVVDCAGGIRAVQTAFGIVRRGGRIVAIGGAPDDNYVSLPANIFLMKDLHIDGVVGYTTNSWIRTLGLLTSGRLRLAHLITHRLQLGEFQDAVRLLVSRTEPLGKVIVSLSDR
jgi:threonine dehydrogenase-like Zn-dependent dehydrogenase